MAASGFTWVARKGGEVQVFHHGKPATTLRGAKAAAFLDLVRAAGDAAVQHELARLTGNYKRGNERLARTHPRYE